MAVSTVDGANVAYAALADNFIQKFNFNISPVQLHFDWNV